MNENLLNLAFQLLPAILVAAVSYYFFKEYTKSEDGRRRFLIHKENQKTYLPLRLQAYERLSLFLERISPGSLLTRVKPYSDDKEAYEKLLLQTIEQEFEHNLTQQIYVSNECWNIIRTAKNATISIIRKTNMSDKTHNSDKLRETILTDLMDNQAPSDAALAFLKNEVSEVMDV